MKTKCPFCHQLMDNMCRCGAYKVIKETYNLPLKEQSYMQGGD